MNRIARIFYDPNVELNPGSGGKTIATTDIGGVQHEQVILEFDNGVGGVTKVSESNPLPCKIESDIQIGAVEIKNGTDDTRAIVTPDNALKVDGSDVIQPISGIVSIDNFPTTQDISGTVSVDNFPAVQDVDTGLAQPLTNTELRNTPVPISGTVTANTGFSQPLTDTQLRATPVPVSGSVTANAGTNLNTSALNLEATQALIKSKTDNIDVAISTRASEATLSNINTKTPALGQALAAASVPVVLTAAQITTLTPPAAITGYNLEATQLLVKAKTDNLDVLLSTRASESTLASVIKNEDSIHSSGDAGIMTLAVRQDSDVAGSISNADGDYTPLAVGNTNRLKVEPNAFYIVDTFSSITGWSAINNDTGNIALSLNHIIGTGSISFDKLNGTANTRYALIQKTLISTNFLNAATASPFFQAGVFIPDTTNVTSIVVRIGTDSSNYNEWAMPINSSFLPNTWQQVRWNVIESTGFAGNGWNATSVTYIAVGAQFNLETNTLAGILWDGFVIVGGTVTDASLANATTVNSANVNVNQVSGNAVAVNAGNRTNGTQRITLASNDILVTDFETVFGTASLITTTQADGIVNTTDGLQTTTFPYNFNGTSFDRVAGAQNALNSTGTGLSTAQMIAQFDDTSPTSITENRFGNVRMSANRNLYNTIRDAAGNERGVNVNANNELLVNSNSTATGVLNNGTETAATGTAAQVIAANSSRKSVMIQNTGVANVRIGITGVTATTGIRLVPNGNTILNVTSAIFAIREGGVSSTVLAQEIT